MSLTEIVNARVEIMPREHREKYFSSQGVRDVFIGHFGYFMGPDGFIGDAGASVSAIRVDDGWPVEDALRIPRSVTLETSQQSVINAFSEELRATLKRMSMGAYCCGAD